MVKAYNKKRKLEEEEKITIAYMTAAWSRAKKLPNLKQILKSNQPKKSMTAKEMFERVKMLNAAFGGDVKEGREIDGN